MQSGSKVTLIEWVSRCVIRKAKLGREEFEGWVKQIAEAFPNNIIPTTWYMYKRILNVPNLHEFVHHFCDCGTYRYPFIPKSQHEQHRHDCCPNCSEDGVTNPRFVTDKNNRLVPKRWCFYFGLSAAIREMLFANPRFVARRGAGRVHAGPDSFRGSLEYDRINTLLHGALDKLENSEYSSFVDFFEAFGTKPHSTGVVMLRCEDMSEEDKGLLEFAIPLMVIPGPKQPPYSSPYMELIAEDFERCTSDGIEIDCALELNASKQLIKVPVFRHKPILVGLDADTPAAQWVMGSVKSSQARISCFKCKVNGCKSAAQYGTKAMVFPGYAEEAPAATVGLGIGQRYKIGSNDEARRLTPDEYKKRVDEVVSDGAADPQRRWGFYGSCPFLEHLKYLDFRYFARLPTHHALLLGLCKDFWVNVLRWASGGKRRPAAQCVCMYVCITVI